MVRLGTNVPASILESHLILSQSDIDTIGLPAINPFIASVRKLCLNSNEDSYWRDVVWCNILANAESEAKDVFDIIAKKIYSLLALQRAFDSFYSKDSTVQVQQLEDLSFFKHELRFLLNNLAGDRNISMELLLGALLEYSTRGSLMADDDSTEPNPDLIQSASDEINVLVNYLDRCTKRLAISGDEKDKTPGRSALSENSRFV
jgi:hypothetical protein